MRGVLLYGATGRKKEAKLTPVAPFLFSVLTSPSPQTSTSAFGHITKQQHKTRRVNFETVTDTRGWKIGVLGVRFSAEAGNFSLHHRVQTDSEAHPVSYPMGTRDSFPGGKVAGA
jgi:hypothetical protein